MFWKKKNKDKKSGTVSDGKPSREEILALAKERAAAARAEIGDETLNKIKAALEKKQASAIERAKAQIKAADEGKVSDNIKFMMGEDKPTKR